jgi:hypothetical protein
MCMVIIIVHSKMKSNNNNLVPAIEHDHEYVAGAVPHPHHDGSVPVVVLLL